jgi:1,4-alpha-glucan branching enzyme
MMRGGREKGKKVAFSLLAPHAENVSLAGDFNDWDPMAYRMKKD